jgi:hypothetical protein
MIGMLVGRLSSRCSGVEVGRGPSLENARSWELCVYMDEPFLLSCYLAKHDSGYTSCTVALPDNKLPAHSAILRVRFCLLV